MGSTMRGLSSLITALGRAIEGQRILFITATQKEAREYFLRVPAELQGVFRRTNGNESVTFPNGGGLDFKSTSRSGRGLSVDRVYVPSSISDDDLASVLPSIAASRDGAVIYY